MAGFDIPKAMETLYEMLEAADWTRPSTEPDEWLSWDGRYEVNIAHSSQMCTIRYRRTIARLPEEATQDYTARKARLGWSGTMFKPHGQAETPFVEWLGRSFGTIVVWCTQMESVAKAPGEE
jgi:hypothetical protein